MLLTDALTRAVLLLRADAGALDVLVAVVVLAIAATVLLAARRAGGIRMAAGASRAFADVRPRLRATEASAPGHRRARAPGVGA